MFPAGGHLGLDTDLPDTILKGDHTRTVEIKFGSNWSNSFVEENLSMYFPYGPMLTMFPDSRHLGSDLDLPDTIL